MIYVCELGPTIEEHEKLVCIPRSDPADPSLPPAQVVDRDHAFAGKRPGFDSLVPPTHVVTCTRPALPWVSLRNTGHVIRRPRRAGCSEWSRAADIPRYTARSHFSHAHPPCPCMGVSTNSGVSHTPRTHTYGQRLLFDIPFLSSAHPTPPHRLWTTPYRIWEDTSLRAGRG